MRQVHRIRDIVPYFNERFLIIYLIFDKPAKSSCAASAAKPLSAPCRDAPPAARGRSHRVTAVRVPAAASGVPGAPAPRPLSRALGGAQTPGTAQPHTCDGWGFCSFARTHSRAVLKTQT